MSAKLLHSLAEDSPDLQKQIGCMTGIFHLFDRHHILTGRRINGQSHKKLPPGLSSYLKGGKEHNNECPKQRAIGNKLNKNVNEKQTVSIESSRASFSSSPYSSSLSSLDRSKTTQPEPSSFFDLAGFPETSSNASLQLGRRSLDLRDVVKDSIYREARVNVVPVKTATRQESVDSMVKHRDSPRPLQLSKSVDGSCGEEFNGKPTVDLNESLGVLDKLREAPLQFDEAREQRRSSNEAKDAPRFSCDGRAGHRKSFESREMLKSASKLKELPRLSVDSRERSMRSSTSDSKSASILRDIQRGSSGNSDERIPNLQQELGTQKHPPPGVVAKLMGLEPLPESISVNKSQMGLIKTCSGEDCDTFSRSSKTTDKGKENPTFVSAKSFSKDPVAPRLQNRDSFMKPISSSRHPIEKAPWRQQDRSQGFQKRAFRNEEAPTRTQNPSPPVYSEIVKRLNELELKQSDEDLRALKQILETIQEKGLVEKKREEDQASNFESQRIQYDPNYTNPDQKPRLANRQNPHNNRPISPTIKRANSPRTSESPIVIMKPAKLVKKSGAPPSVIVPTDGLSRLRKPQSGDSADVKKVSADSRTAKDLTQRNNLREPTNQHHSSTDKNTNIKTPSPRSRKTSSMPQQSPRENSTSSGRNPGSVSPRLQQKKLELEKRSHPPTPSSELRKPRMQSNSLGSPRRKLGAKSPNRKQGNDQLSETSCETRNSTPQGDEITLQSDSNINLESQIDTEVTSADSSDEINYIFFQQGNQIPRKKVANYPVFGSEQKKPTARLSEDGTLVAQLATVSSVHPSPVSVLDASFYPYDMPSSARKASNTSKDDETRNSDDNPGEDEWNPVDLNQASDCMKPNLISVMNHNKLENIDDLVQKLSRLNPTHDEASTDYIASLCENTNPDYRYISEILLASGLLLQDLTSDLTSIQLHPSGHPINPDLFFVLEQTKPSTSLSEIEHSCEKVARTGPNEKIHRKLIFDVVNEILVDKLALAVPSPEPWIHHDKLARRTMNAQRLLKELCSEMQRLHPSNSSCSLDDEVDGLKIILLEEVMNRSENWTNFHEEVSGLPLDIERSIFMDLVDEIVSGEAATLRAKPIRRRHRQLFPK